MKIRAITIGINLGKKTKQSQISRATHFLTGAKQLYSAGGYDVQTIRITTQLWSGYCRGLSKSEVVKEILTLEQLCQDNGVEFISIGTVCDPWSADVVPDVVSSTNNVSCSIPITSSNRMDPHMIQMAARTILRIAHSTDRGYGNFRFAAIANCPPDIPFYPAGYHMGRTCFSIALESSDVVSRVFKNADDLHDAEKEFKSMYTKELKKIEAIGAELEKGEKIKYRGIDVSPAPSLHKNESLVYAFERLGIGTFGGPGTLTICAMITRVLQKIQVRKCGYSGLMLPVLEDCGLAQRYSEGSLNMYKILAYSAVCGTGLDCIPLPGNVQDQTIRGILHDVATLAVKLNKPLSARLLPVPEKLAGEQTDFQSPYLIDCTIQPV